MLRISDVLFGIRNLLLVSLCLLFVSAVLASLFGLVSLSYPADAFTNVSLWIAVVVGSFATTSTLPRLDKSWLLGGVVGGSYGGLVFVVMVAFYVISGAFSGQVLLGLVLAIVLYAVLGLAGGAVGGLTNGQQRDF